MSGMQQQQQQQPGAPVLRWHAGRHVGSGRRPGGRRPGGRRPGRRRPGGRLRRAKPGGRWQWLLRAPPGCGPARCSWLADWGPGSPAGPGAQGGGPGARLGGWVGGWGAGGARGRRCGLGERQAGPRGGGPGAAAGAGAGRRRGAPSPAQRRTTGSQRLVQEKAGSSGPAAVEAEGWAAGAAAAGGCAPAGVGAPAAARQGGPQVGGEGLAPGRPDATRVPSPGTVASLDGPCAGSLVSRRPWPLSSWALEQQGVVQVPGAASPCRRDTSAWARGTAAPWERHCCGYGCRRIATTWRPATFGNFAIELQTPDRGPVMQCRAIRGHEASRSGRLMSAGSAGSVRRRLAWVKRG
jgi:hypothetical protein